MQAILRQSRLIQSRRHLLAGLLLFISSCAGLARDLPEHQVKAAFLFNFAVFVTWPEQAFESPKAPLRYCLQEAEDVAGVLEQLLAGENVDGRPLQLIRLAPDAATGVCHILYLGEGDGEYHRLGQQETRDLLTVGDTEAFIEKGGMVALLRKRKRIHPVIRKDVLAESRLKLSSKLLRLATLVGPERDE